MRQTFVLTPLDHQINKQRAYKLRICGDERLSVQMKVTQQEIEQLSKQIIP